MSLDLAYWLRVDVRHGIWLPWESLMISPSVLHLFPSPSSVSVFTCGSYFHQPRLRSSDLVMKYVDSKPTRACSCSSGHHNNIINIGSPASLVCPSWSLNPSFASRFLITPWLRVSVLIVPRLTRSTLLGRYFLFVWIHQTYFNKSFENLVPPVFVSLSAAQQR